MSILKIRDAEGNVHEVLAIKGNKGDPGEFTGGELLNSHINNKENPHKATAKQVGAAPATESTEHPGCYYRIVDDTIEWINPPMMPSVEYRTTERYNGYVVYTMIVDCGRWVDGKNIIVNLGQLVTAIDSFGEVYGEILAPITGDISGTKICSYKITPSDISTSNKGLGITLIDGRGNNANYDLQTYVTIKYIKYHPMGE